MGDEISEQLSSTPRSLHLSHYVNNANTGFEGWKEMTQLHGFAEEKSLRNVLRNML